MHALVTEKGKFQQCKKRIFKGTIPSFYELQVTV